MHAAINPPTLSEFLHTAREAFEFLGRFGFAEVAAPIHRRSDPFQIWFGDGDRFVVVAGEGYGTTASVTLESNGLELSEIFLVPAAERPGHARRTRRPNQLEQVRESARRLERYGSDFLQGDRTRFVASAKPIPPYKNPID